MSGTEFVVGRFVAVTGRKTVGVFTRFFPLLEGVGGRTTRSGSCRAVLRAVGWAETEASERFG